MRSKGYKILKEAYWIWPGDRFHDLRNSYAHFRKDFVIQEVPECAKLYITADQSYKLWVNGEYLTRGPARGYQSHWPYDEVDIQKYLKTGSNFICVEAYNPGDNTFSYLFQSTAGLLCACDIGDIRIQSDSSWICRIDNAHKKFTANYSKQLAFQEHVDARQDDRSWITSKEAPKDWNKPGTSVFGVMPWHDVEERGIPLLGHKKRYPQSIVSTASGKIVDGYEQWYNVAKGLHIQFDQASWSLKNTSLDNGTNIDIPASEKGMYRAVLLDMGESMVGPSTITIDGGKSGSIVDIFYHEVIDDQYAPVLPDPDTLNSRISMSNRLILRDNTTSYDFYQMLGFRYITIVVQESLAPVTISLSVLDTGYPFVLNGSFECSDKTLNDIWGICLRTQQICSLDAYVDTPWREQAQWWGDARIQFWNTMAIDGDVRLLKRGIRSIAGQRVPNGLTYGHAPTKAHSCILPDFSLVWIISIYDYYKQTGDLSLFEEQLPRVFEVLSYFEKDAPRYNGLLSHDPRYWLFLDWSSLKKDGTPTLYNMWYLMALRMLTQLFELTGRNNEAEVYRLESTRHKNKIEALLFNNDKGLFCDGINEEGIQHKEFSVQSQTFAVLLDLKSEFHTNMMNERVLPFLRGEKLEDPVPSTYWTSYVLTLAREKGYFSEALGFIKRMWSPMIKFSTCPERFNQKLGYGSASHAWSAHPLFHLQNLLGGIVQENVNWDSISFEPYFAAEIDNVNVKVPSPHGVIESKWERKEGKIYVSLLLPKGVRAYINISGYEGEAAEKFECTINLK